MLRFTMFFDPWGWLSDVFLFLEHDGAIVR
jgi:hypothetical protein